MGRTMDISESYSQVIKLVDEFRDEHFNEERIRQWIESRGVPNSLYDAFFGSELGSYVMPVNAGGRACPFDERVAVTMQLTRRAGATLPFLSDMISMALLSTMRSLSQREIAEDLLPRSGRVTFSQAFSEEAAGSDASAVKTVVSLESDEIVLDGRKTFVSNGQFASDTLVLASDPIFGRADGGLSLWLVPLDTQGVSTFPLNTVGQEMLAPAMISFDRVVLDPKWQIQSEGKLASMLKRQYELGRILVCASSLGLARAAMDDALGHAASHMVKGRRLSSLPQIQEKLADMEVRLRSMESLVYHAAKLAGDGGDEARLACALMKRFVPKAATDVASEALQIFGGAGYTDETRVGRIWQDCRGNQIAQGTDEIMVGLIAKLLVSEAVRDGA